MDNAPEAAQVITRHLSTQELADRLSVPLSTIYNWRAYNKGPRAMRVGKYVRYRLEDVQAWEQGQLDPARIA